MPARDFRGGISFLARWVSSLLSARMRRGRLRSRARVGSVRFLLAVPFVGSGPSAMIAAETSASPASLIASSERGWPQFRGPRRDGISDERGLVQSWPEG